MGWAEQEFGQADLGDPRRTARAIRIAETLAAAPEASIPQACADAAQANGVYRFCDNPHVSVAALDHSHAQATRARACGVARLRVVQDTTSFDWTSHRATRGLGPLEHPAHQGLFVHSALVLGPGGVPLGILGQWRWARDAAEQGKAAERRHRPAAEKESWKWVRGLEACASLCEEEGVGEVLLIGDRESDTFELLAQPRPLRLHLLFRVAQDRCVVDAAGNRTRLFAAVSAWAVQDERVIQVGRAGGSHLRGPARLRLRFGALAVCAPREGPLRHEAPREVWIVQAWEEDLPAGVEVKDRVQWTLLSTAPVTTVEEAWEVVDAYAERWTVERYHFVLKSGCRVEQLQLERRERLERLLSVLAVVAWRLLYVTHQARVRPDAPCTEVLEAAEWKALYVRVHRTRRLPASPPTLAEAVGWLARLGGYVGRGKTAAPPGVATVWRGMRRLRDIVTDVQILAPDL